MPCKKRTDEVKLLFQRGVPTPVCRGTKDKAGGPRVSEGRHMRGHFDNQDVIHRIEINVVGMKRGGLN